MAPPRALRYTRACPRRLVAAPAAVTHNMVSLAPSAADSCFGPPRAAPLPEPRVPLSPLDTFLFVRMLQIPVAFFYEGRIDPAQLETSLSRTLARFPLIAGAQPCWSACMRARAERSACAGRLRAAEKRAAATATRAAAAAPAPAAVQGDFDVLCNNEGVIFDVCVQAPGACAALPVRATKSASRCALTRVSRSGSFNCDGALADFDGYADWSVVGKHTQPINNTTPPVRRPPPRCVRLPPCVFPACFAPSRGTALLHTAASRGRASCAAFLLASLAKRSRLRPLLACSASAASWTRMAWWRARRPWRVSAW